MRDALRWIGILLATLVAIVAVVFAAYRVRGPSQAQREALAVLTKNTRPDHGTNAFPLLWFMSYDVPDDQIDARMAEDIVTVQKRLAENDASLSTYAPPLKKLPEATNDTKALCEVRKAGCLAKVAADVDAARRAINGFPRMLAHDAAFERTDFYWNDFPLDSRALLFAYPGNAQTVWLTAYAVKFVDGDRTGAMADVCANIGTWRRLHRGTNTLIGSMFAIAFADGGMRLFADMLARLPPNEEVPSACTDALAPIAAADVDRCAEMSGEFRFSQSVMAQAQAKSERSWWDRAQAWFTYEPKQTDAWRAEQNAAYCGAAAIERMLNDSPSRGDEENPVAQRLECVASVAGCILADIAKPAYAGYDERTLDYAAHLRLAAALLWLRTQDAADPAVAFDRRPDALRSGHRKSGFDEKSAALFVENKYAQKEGVFELPVRPSGPQASGAPAATTGATIP